MTSSNGSGRISATGKPPSQAAAAPDAWQATRAQTSLATQFLKDADDYLEEEKRDIGRQTHPNERELFVSCAAAEALQQQFEHLRPEFIAVHDVATTSSRRLLAGVAAASQRIMQKLVIRRQGYGTALATIEFIELPTSEGGLLRMYTTDAQTDPASRAEIARMLLAYSRLGVVMVGDMPADRIPEALRPLHDQMVAGPWLNRHLLLLPLASASTLVTQGVALTHGTGVSVLTTPQVTRPADAWNFISGTWTRMRQNAPAGAQPAPALGALQPAGGSSPAQRPADLSMLPGGQPEADIAPSALPARPVLPGSAAPAVHRAPVPAPSPSPAADYVAQQTQPMPLAMRPMPPVPTAADRAAEQNVLARYVHQLSELPGMVSCCVFDLTTRRPLAHAGAKPNDVDLTYHGAELLAAMSTASRTLGFGHVLPEAAITLGSHHLLLRAVPKHPGLALHAVLDKVRANLTLARLQVLRMDSLFDEPPPA
ncbi:hypothetical protein BH11PSE8_BH11PSE8_10250 [soil metagenome]